MVQVRPRSGTQVAIRVRSGTSLIPTFWRGSRSLKSRSALPARSLRSPSGDRADCVGICRLARHPGRDRRDPQVSGAAAGDRGCRRPGSCRRSRPALSHGGHRSLAQSAVPAVEHHHSRSVSRRPSRTPCSCRRRLLSSWRSTASSRRRSKSATRWRHAARPKRWSALPCWRSNRSFAIRRRAAPTPRRRAQELESRAVYTSPGRGWNDENCHLG